MFYFFNKKKKSTNNIKKAVNSELAARYELPVYGGVDDEVTKEYVRVINTNNF